MKSSTQGLLFGALGVLIFSFSLPATRLAVPVLGGWSVGFGRAVIAGLLSLALLVIRREPLPTRSVWWNLAVVVLGVIVGFPVLSSLALQYIPASHSAVIVGLAPAATALMAVLRGNERPPRIFWLSCGLGIVAVLIFALASGAGQIQREDLLLLGAVVLVGLGYAEGARLARSMGGWRVICWALVLALPFMTVAALISLNGRDLAAVSAKSWLAFSYLSAFSMFLGFFAWYHGLAVGGIARVSQLQLAQPVLTLLWSAILLGESIAPVTVIAALFVVLSVAMTQLVMRRFAVQPGEPIIPQLDAQAATLILLQQAKWVEGEKDTAGRMGKKEKVS